MTHARLSRRAFFLGASAGALALAAGTGSGRASAAESRGPKISPDEALRTLKQGNEQFLRDKTPARAAVLDRERRLEIARSQTPFAVLVSCSDSRVPPELLFGRGLGELFIVRNAGNTVDNVALGSIEYAVAVLRVPLVVVLGHERCGAVAAALDVVENNATFPGSVGQMIEPIIPAVLKARTSCDCKGEALLDAAVRENVRRIVTRLRTSEPVLMDPLAAGALRIVGARYDLDDGNVDFFIE